MLDSTSRQGDLEDYFGTVVQALGKLRGLNGTRLSHENLVDVWGCSTYIDLYNNKDLTTSVYLQQKDDQRHETLIGHHRGVKTMVKCDPFDPFDQNAAVQTMLRKVNEVCASHRLLPGDFLNVRLVPDQGNSLRFEIHLSA